MAEQVLNITVNRAVREFTVVVTPTSSKVVDVTVSKLGGPPGLSAYEVAVANDFPGNEVEWLESLKGRAGAIGEGEKITGIDAGILGQESLTNDYKYTCVQTGDRATAIWKKQPLFQSV